MKVLQSFYTVLTAGFALALLSSAMPADAHHSFGLYDMTKSSEIAGTVSKMEWSNPHCWLFVVVAAPDNTDVTYGFEMTSVGEMVRRGWNKSALKPGDKVTVKYHPVRDGRTAGYLQSVTTADGRLIGHPIPAPPQPESTAAPPGESK